MARDRRPAALRDRLPDLGPKTAALAAPPDAGDVRRLGAPVLFMLVVRYGGFLALVGGVLAARALARRHGVERALGWRVEDALVVGLVAALAAGWVGAAVGGLLGGWCAAGGVGAEVVVAVLAFGWWVDRAPGWRRALAEGVAVLGLAISGQRVLVWLMLPSKVPDVVLTDRQSGERVTLRQVARGRPMVVNLWATWCGPCRAELPAFEAVQDQHRSVVMVFVNVGEPDAKVLRYLVDAGLDLEHVMLDPGRALPAEIGSYSLPTTVFYGADGRRLDSYVGALSGPALIGRMEDNGLL